MTLAVREPKPFSLRGRPRPPPEETRDEPRAAAKQSSLSMSAPPNPCASPSEMKDPRLAAQRRRRHLITPARVLARGFRRSGETRAAARRGRALFPAPVALDALPRRHLERAEGATITVWTGPAFSTFTATACTSSATVIPKSSPRSRPEIDRLPFSPRRYTNRAAIALARRLADLRPRVASTRRCSRRVAPRRLAWR